MPASPHRRPTARGRLALAGAATVVAVALGAVPLIVTAGATAPAGLDRGALPAGDGWAASGAGTGYSLDAYLRAYDPAARGRAKLPAGPQEDARKAAQGRQAARMVFSMPARTTVIGVPGTGAGITGGSLVVNVVQRAPLARAGRIHLYDNLYATAEREGYAHRHSINPRAGAQVVAENNHWTLSPDREVSQLLIGDGTGAVAGGGNLVDGKPADPVAAYNAANPGRMLKTSVSRKPTLSACLEPAAGLPAKPAAKAGAGLLTETGSAPAPAPTAAAPSPSAPAPSGTPKAGGGTYGNAGSATASYTARTYLAGTDGWNPAG
ncbi:hypothetical protein [Streptomyces sp. NPDC058701]|uniref:hypothetical protein n=1 Tax=Streptomyces sp. NPDC058701 TaxID=3346608 RepID=UPI003659AC41